MFNDIFRGSNDKYEFLLKCNSSYLSITFPGLSCNISYFTVYKLGLDCLKVSGEWMQLPVSPRCCIALTLCFDDAPAIFVCLFTRAAGQKRWVNHWEDWWSEWPPHSPPDWRRRVSTGQTEKQQEEKEGRVPPQTSHHIPPNFSLLFLLPSPTEHAQVCSASRVNCFDLTNLIVPVIRFSRGLNPISSVFQ